MEELVAILLAQLAMLILLYLLSCLFVGLFANVVPETNRIVAYPKHIVSERELTKCQPFSACNVLYRRLWLPNLVERHCRCIGTECSSTWASLTDNLTMSLDNRAQLKFCSTTETLPQCASEDIALKVSIEAPMNMTGRYHYSHLRRVRVVAMRESETANTTDRYHKHRRLHEPRTVQVNCRCPEPHYWMPDHSDPDIFHCAQLQKCDTDELCGYIREDMHSTHYLCSCPKGHQCLSKTKQQYQQHLLLYSGPVYYAYCTPTQK